MGFWSLIVTQFQGAFNDNGLKFLVFYLIVERNFPAHRARPVHPAGGRAVCHSFHFIFTGGRISCRPLQQTQRHDRHETFLRSASEFSLSLLSPPETYRWKPPPFF